MNEEVISTYSAAQRLGLMVGEVKELIQAKKLKTDEVGNVYLESIYKYSGLKEGRHNKAKQKRGRKPALMSYEEAIEQSGIDRETLERWIAEGTLEVIEGQISKRSLKAWLDAPVQEIKVTQTKEPKGKRVDKKTKSKDNDIFKAKELRAKSPKRSHPMSDERVHNLVQENSYLKGKVYAYERALSLLG